MAEALLAVERVVHGGTVDSSALPTASLRARNQGPAVRLRRRQPQPAVRSPPSPGQDPSLYRTLPSSRLLHFSSRCISCSTFRARRAHTATTTLPFLPPAFLDSRLFSPIPEICTQHSS